MQTDDPCFESDGKCEHCAWKPDSKIDHGNGRQQNKNNELCLQS